MSNREIFLYCAWVVLSELFIVLGLFVLSGRLYDWFNAQVTRDGVGENGNYISYHHEAILQLTLVRSVGRLYSLAFTKQLL